MSGWQDHFPWTAAVVHYLWPDGPARRKRWLRFALALLVLLLLHAAMTAWAAAGARRAAKAFEARWGSIADAVPKQVAIEDADNRALAVRAATDMMARGSAMFASTETNYEEYAKTPSKTLSASGRELLRKAAADNALTMALLDAAAARPRSSWQLHYEKGFEVDVPPLLRLLQLSKLNAAMGRLAVEEGRIDDAITAARRGAAISSSLENEPILIVQLIRQAVEKYDAGLARWIVASGAARADQIAALAAIPAPPEPRAAMQHAMALETKTMAGLFRDGAGASKFDRVGGSGASVASAAGSAFFRWLFRPYLLRQERLWLTMMTTHLHELDAPRAARPPSPSPSWRSWDFLVRAVASTLGSIVERCDLSESRERLRTTSLEIARLRLETGRAPSSPPSAPVDPLTGKPFAYESDGTSWRLRSVADVSSMESAAMSDPVLDWTGGPPR